MSDEIYESDEQTELEIDEVLDQVIRYCAEEAKEKLIETGSFEPFTVVVEGEDMYVETHPGEDPESIQASAKATVASASSFATHYCFCIDGYVDTDQGQLDAIVIEGAERDMDEAYIIVNLYKIDESGEGSIEFEEELAFLDTTETWIDRTAVKAAEDAEMTAAQEELERSQTQAEAQKMLDCMNTMASVAGFAAGIAAQESIKDMFDKDDE